MDSHNYYSADSMIVQDYSAHQRVVQESHSDYSEDPRVLQYSADPKLCNFNLTRRGKWYTGKLL